MKKEILEKINSDSLPLQIAGLDEAITVLDHFTDQLTGLLETSGDSLFVAERISAIMERLQHKLETTFQETRQEQVRFQIAMIFLTNNNFTKVPYLLKFATDTDNISDAIFCLTKMHRKGLPGVKSIAQKWLDKLNDSPLVSDPLKKKDLAMALQDLV
ncbi:hypothetical protein [Taibaiella chishuiensis]|uniref:Uncharacterized protein n=1 Tax=Taibaiella chishuiensis TaxID=1434707 RepID=A0A2P8D791_9BACT|nr:hypothetical protein [Taibaiella chishuiensis]PSK93100.1 hypothetical protein B0I18_10269 [Taibaiella chishuiensis]